MTAPAPGASEMTPSQPTASEAIDEVWATRFRHGAQYVGWFAVAVGSIVLIVGWWFGVREVAAILPNAPTMKANTAVGIGLAGLGVVAYCRGWHQIVVLTAGALTALIGLITLLEYVFLPQAGWFDQLLTPGLGEATSAAAQGRMGANTAVDYVLLGLALILLGLRAWPNVRQWLAVIVAVVGFTAAIGYVLQIHGLSGFFIAAATSMAINTSLLHLALAFAVIGAEPSNGWAQFAVSRYAGGQIFRSFFIPIVGTLILILLAAYMVPTAFGVEPAFAAQINLGLVTLAVLLFVVLIARKTSAIDAGREHTAQQLAASLADAQRVARLESLFAAIPFPILIADQTGQVQFANSKSARLLGYGTADLDGMAMADLIPGELSLKHSALSAPPTAAAGATAEA